MCSIPAAIVRNDTIYVLSRCEDNPTAILGGRTSVLESQPAWMVYISLHFTNPYFIRHRIIFRNMTLPVVAKIPVLYKQKTAVTCWLILPGT